MLNFLFNFFSCISTNFPLVLNCYFILTKLWGSAEKSFVLARNPWKKKKINKKNLCLFILIDIYEIWAKSFSAPLIKWGFCYSYFYSQLISCFVKDEMAGTKEPNKKKFQHIIFKLYNKTDLELASKWA